MLTVAAARDLDLPKPPPTTNLASAVREDNVDAVQLLLAAGADPNGPTDQPRVDAVTLAAYLNRADCLQAMLASGAAVTGSLGMSPWQAAVICGNDASIQVLACHPEIDIHATFPSGTTPLQTSAQLGYDSMTTFLLERGADVTKRYSADGSTALHAAAECGYSIIAAELIAFGANPNERRWDGTTPLYLAAFNGFDKVVDVLLRGGAEIDQRDPSDNSTALICAAQEGHLEVVKRLLESGAAVDMATNLRRYSALCYAAEGCFTEIAKALCASGSNVEHPTVDGSRPMFIALESGADGVVLELLQHGASPTHRNVDGVSPLYIALAAGRLGVVRALLQRGADGNQYNSHQYVGMISSEHTGVVMKHEKLPSSPMMLALHMNQVESVQLMAAYGTSLADISLLATTQKCWRKSRAVVRWVSKAMAAHSSAFEIAVGCRLRSAVTHHLRQGTTLHRGLIQLSVETEPLGHPTTPCKSIRAMLFSAFQPWRPKTHWMFGPAVQTTVLASLLSANRIRHGKPCELTNLPIEMWYQIFSFLTR